MQKRHVRAAVAAVAAPFTLAFLLAGIRADARPAVLDRLSLEVPWPVTTPSAPASAPVAPSAPRAKSTAPPAKAAPATTQPVAETTADAGLLQCCAALHARGETAREDARAAYSAAARTCDAVATSPKAREAMGHLRGQLQGAELPLECR